MFKEFLLKKDGGALRETVSQSYHVRRCDFSNLNYVCFKTCLSQVGYVLGNAVAIAGSSQCRGNNDKEVLSRHARIFLWLRLLMFV